MGEAINTFQRRVKNQFWEVVINWLEALEDNPKTGKLVTFGYRARQHFHNQNPIIFSLMICSLGLAIGLGIGALLAIFF